MIHQIFPNFQIKITRSGLIQADQGLKKLLGKSSLPAPTTMGEFLHKFNCKALRAISMVNAKFLSKVLALKKLITITLDFDSTLIESEKREAMITYEGFDGYDPLLCFISELKLVLRGHTCVPAMLLPLLMPSLSSEVL